MKGVYIKYSDEEMKFLEINKGVSRKELTSLFNNKFNRDVSVNNIKGLCERKGWKSNSSGMFEKGHETWNKGLKGHMGANKTSFAKGNTPKNCMPLGAKRIDGYGHEEQKIGMPNIWKQTRHIVWESENEPVKKGMILRFKDGDTTNIVIDNLECVSRAENLVLNKMKYNTTPEKLKKSVKLMAQISVKKSEIKIELSK